MHFCFSIYLITILSTDEFLKCQIREREWEEEGTQHNIPSQSVQCDWSKTLLLSAVQHSAPQKISSTGWETEICYALPHSTPGHCFPATERGVDERWWKACIQNARRSKDTVREDGDSPDRRVALQRVSGRYRDCWLHASDWSGSLFVFCRIYTVCFIRKYIIAFVVKLLHISESINQNQMIRFQSLIQQYFYCYFCRLKKKN